MVGGVSIAKWNVAAFLTNYIPSSNLQIAKICRFLLNCFWMAFNGWKQHLTEQRREKQQCSVSDRSSPDLENVALSECVLMLIAAEGVCYQLKVMSICSESGGGMRSKTKKIWKTDKQKWFGLFFFPWRGRERVNEDYQV